MKTLIIIAAVVGALLIAKRLLAGPTLAPRDSEKKVAADPVQLFK